jgi:hypothetical protein
MTCRVSVAYLCGTRTHVLTWNTEDAQRDPETRPHVRNLNCAQTISDVTENLKGVCISSYKLMMTGDYVGVGWAPSIPALNNNATFPPQNNFH